VNTVVLDWTKRQEVALSKLPALYLRWQWEFASSNLKRAQDREHFSFERRRSAAFSKVVVQCLIVEKAETGGVVEIQKGLLEVASLASVAEENPYSVEGRG